MVLGRNESETDCGERHHLIDPDRNRHARKKFDTRGEGGQGNIQAKRRTLPMRRGVCAAEVGEARHC